MRQVFLFSIITVITVSCFADTFIVDPSGNGDFLKIQEAINASVYGDTVQVLAGTYVENIKLKNGVALIGEGINTIIDANGSCRAILSSYCDSNTLLEGFMITNDGSSCPGSGMYNDHGSPTVTDCVFSNNKGYDAAGGAMLNYYSSPTVTNCAFSDNESYNGAGILNFGGSPTVTNCEFRGNRAVYGGGISNLKNSEPIVAHCIFSENLAVIGGGVHSDSSSLTLSNCIFTRNSAFSKMYPNWPKGNGGGVGLYGGTCIATNCTFSGNLALIEGGALYNKGCEATLTNCILWGNTASESGDEIYNYGLTVIRYCDVAGWNDSIGTDGGGNIDANPLFINQAGKNFRLQSDSPCIDSGDPNYPYDPNETDLGGNPRIINDRIDMGVYEYWPPIEVEAKLTPQSLNRKSSRPYVIGRLELVGFSDAEIDPNEPMVLMPSDIPAESMEILPGKNGAESVTLVGFFDNAALMAAIAEDRDVEVTIAARLTSGQWVYGMDVVRVK